MCGFHSSQNIPYSRKFSRDSIFTEEPSAKSLRSNFLRMVIPELRM